MIFVNSLHNKCTMASTKTKVSMAGVAEGRELIGVPTGDDVSAEDRVKALLFDSMAADVYQVSTHAIQFRYCVVGHSVLFRYFNSG